MLIAHYLGIIRAGEEQLAEAYKVVSERHSREFEVRERCKQFAEWSAGHVETLKPFIERYGEEKSVQPEQLRSSLFHGVRAGGLGLLKDLQDLDVLVGAVRSNWTIVNQAAGASQDRELERLAIELGEQLDREEHWLCTQIKDISPQVMLVTPDVPKEAEASVPKQPTTAALPDQVWAPLVAGVLSLIVGLVSLVVGKSWLFPSLGPTMFLQAENPAHPSTRFYNTVAGHLVGLLAGFLAVFIFNANNDPVTLQTGQLTPGRMGASVVALALTLLVTLLIKASHPPAGATTLLVSLGAINDLNKALFLVAGVLLVALLGEAVRAIRLGRPERAAVQPKVPSRAGR